MIEWPDVHLRVFEDSRGGSHATSGYYQCVHTSHAAQKDGVHFITLSSQASQDYSISVIDLEKSEHFSESGNTDVGYCASPGILFPGETATGTITGDANTHDPDSYLVRMQAGVRYRFEAKGSSSNSGTLYDPVIHIVPERGRSLLVVSPDLGEGPDELWEQTVEETGTYLFLVRRESSPDAGTYTVIFNAIGVTNEPDGQDLMPDGNRTAGYLSTQSDLDGTFSDGDYSDGFTIDAATGKSYRLTVSERGGTGGYRNIQASVWRHDGASYTMLDTSYTRGGFDNRAKNRHHSGGVHLHFTAETPPQGVTYTYHGEARPFGVVDRNYTGGYRVSLVEDDHREILDAETFHTGGTITVSPDETAASIETDGDADTLIFRLDQGSDYVIAVRAGPSAGGRTLPHATVEHLRWSEDNLLQRRHGAVDQALLTEAAGISAGEFLLRFTAPETAYYMLTVRGRSGETGAYTVAVSEQTRSEVFGKDLPDGIWTTAKLEAGTAAPPGESTPPPTRTGTPVDLESRSNLRLLTQRTVTQ